MNHSVFVQPHGDFCILFICVVLQFVAIRLMNRSDLLYLTAWSDLVPLALICCGL